MKFIRKRQINEGYFKTPEEIKKERENRGFSNAEVLAKTAQETILKVKKPLLENLLVAIFVNPIWWNGSDLSESTNLRPGNSDAREFMISGRNISEAPIKERVEYLYEHIPFNYKFANGGLTVEVELQPSNYPVNNIIFKGNGFFNFLTKAEKYLTKHLQMPAYLKIKIGPWSEATWSEHIIRNICIYQKVAISKFVNFFKERVVEIGPAASDIYLGLYNRANDTDFSELIELKDFIKFDCIYIKLKQDFLKKMYTPSTKGKIIFTQLETLDGMSSLLKPDAGSIIVGQEYTSNPVFKEYLKTTAEDVSVAGNLLAQHIENDTL